MRPTYFHSHAHPRTHLHTLSLPFSLSCCLILPRALPHTYMLHTFIYTHGHTPIRILRHVHRTCNNRRNDRRVMFCKCTCCPTYSADTHTHTHTHTRTHSQARQSLPQVRRQGRIRALWSVVVLQGSCSCLVSNPRPCLVRSMVLF